VEVGNDPGQCFATVDPGQATATDAVDGALTTVGVRGDGKPLTDPYPVGMTLITWTATNARGQTASCEQRVTVRDAEAPQITGLAVDKSHLWPANRKLVLVTVNYGVADNCDPPGSLACRLEVSSSDGEDGGRRDRDPDWVVVDAHHVRLRAQTLKRRPARVYTIHVLCTDASGNTREERVTVTVGKPPRR
jgi:hypothetical protein